MTSAYSDKKSSGVDWLGEIPSHWNVSSLKRVLSEPLKYGATEAGDCDDRSLPRYLRITDFDNDGSLRTDTFASLPEEIACGYYVNEGDVLFARSGATVGKTFLFRNYQGRACFAGYLIKASPARRKLTPEFLYYFTKSPAYEAWKDFIFTQATIQNIGADKYAYLPICLPPLREQQRIAAYLDASCAAIDAAVAAKRRQLETLDALRKSLVQQTITNGLGSAVPRKPTDSLYLPAVPTHWAVRSLKHCANILNGYAFDSTTYVEDGVPIIRIGDVAATIDWTKVKRVPSELLSALSRFIIQRDDILVALTGATIGKSTLYRDDTDALLNQRVAVLRASRINAEFLNYIIQTHVFTEPIDLLCSGGAQDNIGKGEVGGIKIPVPPLDEQERIVGFLNEKTERLLTLSGVLETQIATLTAYRKSLIHECVTGQRRVTEVDVQRAAAHGRFDNPCAKG